MAVVRASGALPDGLMCERGCTHLRGWWPRSRGDEVGRFRRQSR